MPWVFVPIKDVHDCVKLRGAVKKRYYPEMSEWENLVRRNARLSIAEGPA